MLGCQVFTFSLTSFPIQSFASERACARAVARCGSCRDTWNVHRWPRSPESFLCTCVNSQCGVALAAPRKPGIQEEKEKTTSRSRTTAALVGKVCSQRRSICIDWCINVVRNGVIIAAQTSESRCSAEEKGFFFQSGKINLEQLHRCWRLPSF